MVLDRIASLFTLYSSKGHHSPPPNKNRINMSSRSLHFLWLFVLVGFVRANERRLTESRGFVVAIGAAAPADKSVDGQERICVDTERDAIQREVRYFIRKRAREYMHVVVDLKEDVKEDPEFLDGSGRGRYLQRSGLRNSGNVRQRQQPTVVHPWGGRGEFECTHCDSHGEESRLRKQSKTEGSSLDAEDFKAFMDTQLTQDIIWVVKALRGRQTTALNCLGDILSLKVSFNLD
jgi:hypothetical protein